jgi:multidrug efflux pump subunit AcrB
VDLSPRTSRIGRGIEFALKWITAFYTKTLVQVLHHPKKVLLLAFAFFGLSLFTLTLLNKEFLPSEDQSRFNIRLKTPIGSSLVYSDVKFSEAEKLLAKRPEVDRYVLQVGGGSLGDANSGSVLVTMKEKGKRGIDPELHHEMSQSELMNYCRRELKKVPDLRVSIQDLSTKNFTASRGFPVEFSVQGPDWDQLAGYSHQITHELEKTGLVTDIDTNYESAMPEYQIVPDRVKAASRGVSIFSIGQTINAMIGGVLVGRYPKNGHRYDINLKLEETKEEPTTLMKSLFVRNNHGEMIRLSELVKIEMRSSMVEINRLQRERAITVYANVTNGRSQQDALKAVEDISKKILPRGYHAVFSGSSQTFNESFQSLLLALLLGLIIAYMVLASQFNSFIDPVSVLMALPFSVSGAFIALYLTHQSINIYSMIGLVLLMGIVKKNSILLVDFTNQVKATRSLSASEALLEARPIRLRPVLMTSVATIAGAVPAAISFGPGAESRIPMAIAVIGGVIASTILTLYVVPATYSLLSKKTNEVTRPVN